MCEISCTMFNVDLDKIEGMVFDGQTVQAHKWSLAAHIKSANQSTGAACSTSMIIYLALIFGLIYPFLLFCYRQSMNSLFCLGKKKKKQTKVLRFSIRFISICKGKCHKLSTIGTEILHWVN